MTQNQINYAKLLEDRRTHQVNEQLIADANKETRRSNLAKEAETFRSNTAKENLTQFSNLETARSNRARELETNRHNLELESLESGKLSESQRHNVQTELLSGQQNIIRSRELEETSRSNRAREYETQRSNVARETETHRSNVTQEQETYRSHLASERLRGQEIALGYSNLAESTRHNLTSESQNLIKLKQDALLRGLSVYEDHRSNLAKEQETARSNLAKESETRRHNQAIEELDGRSVGVKEYQSKHSVIQGYINAGANVAKAAGRVIQSTRRR